jgi:hypothetical protein
MLAWLRDKGVDTAVWSERDISTVFEDLKSGKAILTDMGQTVRRSMQALKVRVMHPQQQRVLIFRASGKPSETILEWTSV